MNKSRVWRHFLLILLFLVFLGLTINPKPFGKLEPITTPGVSVVWNNLVVGPWNWMQDSRILLGLDLQGGTQLDYEIDLRQANEFNQDDDDSNDVDITQLLEGVKDVITRRVDSLGVSEAEIYLSSVGEEQHIVVEMPGVEDIDEAKDKVGKVVQLEFKTEKEEPTDEEIAEITTKAEDYRDKLAAEGEIEDLEAYMEDDIVPDRVVYKKNEKQFIDEFPGEFRNEIEALELNTFSNELIRAQETDYVYLDGQFVQPEGYNILRVTAVEKELRKLPRNAESFDTVLEELGQTASEEDVAVEDVQPEELGLEVSTLGQGEITGVVDSEEGFFIGQLRKKISAHEGEDPQIRTSHILLKTEKAEALKELNTLAEIPDDATEEERAEIEASNKALEEENATLEADNAEIEARNAETEENNAAQKAQAEELLAKIKEDPSQFEDLAREFSEDSSAEQGGDLGYSLPTAYVEAYREAALALEKGEITDELVESPFGYHIIKLVDLKQPDEERLQYAAMQVCYEGAKGCESTLSKEDAKAQADELLRRVREESVYTVERVWFNAVPDPWRTTELDGRFFKRADVAYNPTNNRPYVQVQFNDEGAELFEQITGDNVDKRIAIFVGGEFINAPVVQEKISGGIAQITLGSANPNIAVQEATELARSLNAGSIPAPLKKPNELNIGATLGAQSLEHSQKAGVLGLALVILFMIVWYRGLGLMSALSLVVYGFFLIFIIQSQINPVIALLLTFGMWLAFALSLSQSKMDGLAKFIFLMMSILGVYFLFSVLITPIVLTLAGVAGMILSIGMAVDANILIFERIKEEFAEGKSYYLAVKDGFDRAWTSILDSNVSTLITCGILYSFGTSIIKGFAINLAVGVVISMFTAISVSRTFLYLFEGTALEKVKWLWKRK